MKRLRQRPAALQGIALFNDIIDGSLTADELEAALWEPIQRDLNELRERWGMQHRILGAFALPAAMLDENGTWRPDRESLERVYGPEFAAEMMEGES